MPCLLLRPITMFVDALLNSFKKQPKVEVPTQPVFDSPPRVQFILKQRDYLYTQEGGNYSYGTLESGLFNSARFVCNMLNNNGCVAEIIQVVDNNGIDREVTRFKPDFVIIEALWVVPEKFEVLRKLHPKVKWVVRNHSAVPFLANEGIAIEWAFKYAQQDNVFFSSNERRTNRDFGKVLGEDKAPYLPNYYPINEIEKKGEFGTEAGYISIGLFGAVRPLKNQLEQCFAAYEFSRRVNKHLILHINGGRMENRGEPVIKNIRAFFEGLGGKATLIEHPWLKHDDFLTLLASMDLCLQTSYTETYNIVSADATSQDVPVVTCDDIFWNIPELRADPNSTESIVEKLGWAYEYGRSRETKRRIRENLDKYNEESVRAWLEFLC